MKPEINREQILQEYWNALRACYFWAESIPFCLSEWEKFKRAVDNGKDIRKYIKYITDLTINYER